MPSGMQRDYWWTYQDLEGWRAELTPAQPADSGTSQPSPVLVVPSGLGVEMNTVWNGREWTKLIMVGNKVQQEVIKLPPTEEELKKHIHNPRGLDRPTVPAIGYFKKDLPEVGSKVYLQTFTGRMTPGLSTAAAIFENDEESVYFVTEGNLGGYICSCFWCRKSWSTSLSELADRDLEARTRGNTHFSPQYIGHIGSIRRAYHLDLPLVNTPPGAEIAAGYHCHMRNMAPYGMLRNNLPHNKVLYAVPEFGDEPMPEMADADEAVVEWPSPPVSVRTDASAATDLLYGSRGR